MKSASVLQSSEADGGLISQNSAYAQTPRPTSAGKGAFRRGVFEVTPSDWRLEQYDDLEAMSAIVRLSYIVDALEMQFDESSSFVDRDTGRVETVSHVLLRDAEEFGDDEEPDRHDWQKQEWEIAKLVVSTDRFQKLPTKFEIHEWAIMQDFAHSVESDRIREDLLHTIYRNGAQHRISLVCIPRGGPAGDRTRLVRRESRRMGIGDFRPVDGSRT